MDKRPKRRKSKDNPYILDKIDKKKIYKVLFSNLKGIKYEIEINSEIYNALNQFELDDLKQMNEFDRHIEHLEQSEEMLYKKSIKNEKSIEEQVIQKSLYENLHSEISQLSYIQKRRIKMYFFENMTLQEIANIEHSSCRAVKYSIDIALSKLQKNLKNKILDFKN